ncbi:uncharacterized protein LOC121794449 [Salvia splendens]|uniref:uncharacterized protein LOC121794449 n=1 Tax=Salvia splendens TaxID=180675 RepID=UPI001C27E290|nr:uncharacterized protein LOC121794449 [Salvia splendens]
MMRNVGDCEFDVDVTMGIAQTVGIGITGMSGAETDALLLEIIAKLLAFVIAKLLVAAEAEAVVAVEEFRGEQLKLFTSINSAVDRRLRFRSSAAEVEMETEADADAAAVVGIFSVPLTDVAMAGTVPVPVAAIMAGSACSSSQRMVSPSDLWPSSRVSWKTLAAHVAGIRILRPRPSTFVWRSFVDDLFAGSCKTTSGFSSAVSGTSSFMSAMRSGCAEEFRLW